MKKIILLAVVIISFASAKAQQDAMLSQYMFNGLFLNPAYAGSHPYFTSSLLYRKQWVSFSGAPETMLLAVDGPIAKENMGVGLIVSNDKIGVTNQTDIHANYSYHLKINDKSKISFGAKAGVSQYRAKLTELKVWDSDDQVFMGDVQSVLVPKFGFGVYYYSERMYAGLSIPTLLAYQPGRSFSLDINKSSQIRKHYFFTTGYVHPLNDKIKLKPSVLVKYVPNAPVQADLNMAAMFNDVIWVGVSYRSGDAIVGVVEYQANQRFRVGYSYDFTTSRIRHYSAGSHEIMIGYDFGRDLVNVKTPRFF